MTMKRIVALLLISLAAACVDPQMAAEQQRLREQDDINTCAGYGLRPGTENFALCRMQLDLARRQPAYVYDPGPRFYTGFGYHHWR